MGILFIVFGFLFPFIMHVSICALYGYKTNKSNLSRFFTFIPLNVLSSIVFWSIFRFMYSGFSKSLTGSGTSITDPSTDLLLPIVILFVLGVIFMYLGVFVRYVGQKTAVS